METTFQGIEYRKQLGRLMRDALDNKDVTLEQAVGTLILNGWDVQRAIDYLNY